MTRDRTPAPRPDPALLPAVPPDLPSLTVAISTRGARACGLDPAAWPAAPGLDYLVLAQEAGDPRVAACLAALEARPDVAVHRLATTGLSRSRNAALDAAQGEIVLIADDDVTHLPGAHAGIRAFFAENPGGQPPRRPVLHARRAPAQALRPAPPVACAAGPRAASRATSWRFAAAPVRAAGIRFDEAFGAGAGTPAFLGEEYIFVADCLAAGLRGAYVPLPVSVHPPDSSGFVWAGPAAARARAAAITRVFGPAAAPMRLAFALKNARRFGGLRDLWAFLRG